MNSWLSRFGKRVTGRTGMRVLIGSLALLLVAMMTLLVQGNGEKTVTYTELLQIAAGSGASRVDIHGDRFLIEQADGQRAVGLVADESLRKELASRFAEAGVAVEFAPAVSSGERAAGMLGPFAVLAMVGAGLFVVQRKRQKGHFTELSQGLQRMAVRFDDVAGMDEVKESLNETVEFLKDPEKFARLGGRAPRGVLMTGDPGTGKTLLARAVATEAGVPFLSASGSSFQEMFVGVGASRVRALFAEARKVAPCIVFIDEIDAVGRARGRNGDSAAADHDQTLNQLLVEMDGFDHTVGIVVIASTNRVDVLDPALLRPGRFDRQVVVPLPDVRGREEILHVHSRPIALGQEVDLARIARCTPGFSGAELANLLNEAAIMATREGAESVRHEHIDRARDRVLMGLERKNVLVDEEERYATAVHEAGHVTVALLAPGTDPIHKVSILPRGRALGVTQALPEKDRLMVRKEFLEDQICLLMGGRAAEIVVLGTMTAGASDDIQRAASLARRMVAEFGMSDLGPIGLGGDTHGRSQALLDRVEETARTIVEAQLARAVQMVEVRRAEIDALVKGLLEQETLDADEIYACFPADRRSPAPAPASAPAVSRAA
ncbi:ATP-dependent zinc metalloprotease FtsH [Chondromyces crocatus]|nr:ATP-dependent zinc metalloprotease FtsH [Chondromyces crocatus]